MREPEERLPIKPISKKTRETFWKAIDGSLGTPTNQLICRGIEILLGAEEWWRTKVADCNPYSKMPNGNMECVFCGLGDNGIYREIGEFTHRTECPWEIAQGLK